MGSLNRYADLIKDVLRQYAERDRVSGENDVETHTLFDDESGRYMLFRVG